MPGYSLTPEGALLNSMRGYSGNLREEVLHKFYRMDRNLQDGRHWEMDVSSRRRSISDNSVDI